MRHQRHRLACGATGIERGEHNLTLMNLCRISEALQVKPSTLLVAAGL
jgi:transcriptional regulator with XRE-family HTH domain